MIRDLAGRAWHWWTGTRAGRDRAAETISDAEQRTRFDHIMRQTLRAEAERLFPGTSSDRFGDRYDWQAFVHGHDWPVNCAQCIWWIPAPSEAEDCIAVYQPCKAHEKQHQERRFPA